MHKTTRTLVALAIAGMTIAAHAAVTPEQADKLKTTLTPLGGERAGNADGSIPAWTGKVEVAATPKKGDIPTQPFPGEKPLFQITAANMDKYAARLNDGTKALLKRYPSFHLDVYPTHRTAVTPEYVAENTFRNATRCKLIDGGNSVSDCFGGIPFPIPQNGSEIIWNYLLRVEAEATKVSFRNIVGTADGNLTLATQNDQYNQYPDYYKDGSPAKWSGEYFLQRFSTVAPPYKAGESLVIRDGISPTDPRQTWQYLVGQRRVRRAPTVAYDTPDFVASGANYFDEVQGFMGAPDRFKWKIVGKREMYVPYNCNTLVTSSEADTFARHHMNPDKLRWELHRVWEVEATVAPGKRHAVPLRRYYFDEDTYLLELMDGYDSQGKLWRTTEEFPFFVPSIPAVVVKPVTVFDLQKGTMSMVQYLDSYKVLPHRKPESFFTGEAVAADASQ